jgi:hypothetical protein
MAVVFVTHDVGVAVEVADRIYDGAPWSASDLEDLKGHVAHGASLEETAAFLCRAGTPFEVAAKAKELGLKWQAGGTRRKPDKWPAKPTEDEEP